MTTTSRFTRFSVGKVDRKCPTGTGGSSGDQTLPRKTGGGFGNADFVSVW